MKNVIIFIIAFSSFCVSAANAQTEKMDSATATFWHSFNAGTDFTVTDGTDTILFIFPFEFELKFQGFDNEGNNLWVSYIEGQFHPLLREDFPEKAEDYEITNNKGKFFSIQEYYLGKTCIMVVSPIDMLDQIKEETLFETSLKANREIQKKEQIVKEAKETLGVTPFSLASTGLSLLSGNSTGIVYKESGWPPTETNDKEEGLSKQKGSSKQK